MPNLDVHSVEFEAPLSAESADGPKHYSIDLSLELERQLDMEASSPTADHSKLDNDRTSLDPHVLAHIVKQLQQSLAEVTKDRDELRQLIASSHANEAELQDTLQHMIDKATTMEVQLSDARNKIKDDEEAIALLRSKVEESRRGLMRLQTESRRQSQVIVAPPLDLSRGTFSLGSPPSAKRTSFSPLTGSLSAMSTSRPQGHRRISSVSDTSSPPPSILAFSDTAVPLVNGRCSGPFGRTSPVLYGESEHAVEVVALRKELRSARDELEHTRIELTEAIEAREASETCVKALREFIAENNIGVADQATSVSLPRAVKLPALTEVGRSKTHAPASSTSSWSFRLWKESPSAASSPIVTATPQLPSSTTMPLSRKLGEFFGARTSVASDTSSVVSSNVPVPARDESYSASDSSSVVEPISPSDEREMMVMVKDVTSLADEAGAQLSVSEKDKEVGISVAPPAGFVAS